MLGHGAKFGHKKVYTVELYARVRRAVVVDKMSEREAAKELFWMQPVTRDPVSPGFDYYALLAQDQSAIERMGLSLLYRGKTSGTALASGSPRFR